MSTPLNFCALNIAPQAPRYSPLTWMILFVSVALLCASLAPLTSRIHDLNAVKEQRLKQQGINAAVANKILRHRAGTDTAAIRERANAHNAFRARLQMSWNSVFDALEAAALSVHGGTSIVLMIPKKVAADEIHVDLTALAANLPIMLAYLETLKADPRVRAVDLITQQPDVKTSPDAIRFQITVRMDPTWMNATLQRRLAPPPATLGAQKK